jgi:hypothetical protein
VQTLDLRHSDRFRLIIFIVLKLNFGADFIKIIPNKKSYFQGSQLIWIRATETAPQK